MMLADIFLVFIDTIFALVFICCDQYTRREVVSSTKNKLFVVVKVVSCLEGEVALGIESWQVW